MNRSLVMSTPLAAPNLEPFSLTEYFGNQHPVEIDIGCGKGKFLLGRAETSSGINFLGIDRASKWLNIGKGRAEKRKFENLKFLKTECREFLMRLPVESVSVFHVYFPDPWPKRRHRPRRLVNAGLLTLLHRCLRRNGSVELATDDEDYFSAMKKSVAETAGLWKEIKESVSRRIIHENFKTNYEIKFGAAGLPLYYMELQKS